MPRKWYAILLLLLAALPSSPPAVAQSAPALPVPVVASFTILADFTRIIGGERVTVTSLVGPDADAHSYAATPSDAKTVSDAKLVISNGLGFEAFLPRLISASGTKAQQVIASKGVKPLASQDAHGHGHGHGHEGRSDPHAWQSVANAKVYVANIRDALIAADADGKATYETNAQRYLAELDQLDGEIRAKIGALGKDRRLLVTTHDAFRYFSAAYGMEFRALRGVSSESEPTAKDMAAIIRQIKAVKARAVFAENIKDDRLIQRIAAETGARVGGTLVSDALTDAKGLAPSYMAMMKNNVDELIKALAP